MKLYLIIFVATVGILLPGQSQATLEVEVEYLSHLAQKDPVIMNLMMSGASPDGLIEASRLRRDGVPEGEIYERVRNGDAVRARKQENSEMRTVYFLAYRNICKNELGALESAISKRIGGETVDVANRVVGPLLADRDGLKSCLYMASEYGKTLDNDPFRQEAIRSVVRDAVATLQQYESVRPPRVRGAMDDYAYGWATYLGLQVLKFNTAATN